jgi:hypothetical protein
VAPSNVHPPGQTYGLVDPVSVAGYDPDVVTEHVEPERVPPLGQEYEVLPVAVAGYDVAVVTVQVVPERVPPLGQLYANVGVKPICSLVAGYVVLAPVEAERLVGGLGTVEGTTGFEIPGVDGPMALIATTEKT